ncbi:putative transporter [Streptococcus pyogenes]|nr:putative transporter [Streptococcus pyogenes]
MAHHDKLTKLLKLFLIALGVAIYTFGFLILTWLMLWLKVVWQE